MSPLVMDYIESQENFLYITGLSAYSPLQEIIQPIIQQVIGAHQKSRKPIIRYHSFRYKAASWSKYRRVVAKIEMIDNNLNVRFIVTDMEQAKSAWRRYLQIDSGSEWAAEARKRLESLNQ